MEKNILIAFLLNVAFSVFELIGGLFTGSVAILSDSLHDIGDALSIGISYFLEKKSKKGADNKYTYGYIRYSVLGSIITTVILLVGSSVMIYEAIQRLFNPVEVNYNGMIIFAVLGVVVNTIATYITHNGDSLNQKAVNLHMFEDVLGWIVVLIGSIVMKFTDIVYLDSLLSIFVSVFIFVCSFANMKKIVDIFLEKAPEDVDIEHIKKHIKKIDGVEEVHHIHIRSIDGIKNFATLHAVVTEYSHEKKVAIKKVLQEHNIAHSTVELELVDEECSDKSCHVENLIQHNHHHHQHH